MDKVRRIEEPAGSLETGRNGGDPSGSVEPERGTPLEQAKRDRDTKASNLGGRWDAKRSVVVPSETSLNIHAREIMKVPLLPLWALVMLMLVYYPLIAVLGGIYSVIIAELQTWDGIQLWLSYVGMTLAFVAVSLLVKESWQRAAIARYRVGRADYARVVMFAVGVTFAVLIVDFAVSFLWLNAALESTSMGEPQIPESAVPLMASLTTLGQIVGAFLGWSLGIRLEVHTSWAAKLTREKTRELEALRQDAFEFQRLKDMPPPPPPLPPGHVDVTPAA